MAHNEFGKVQRSTRDSESQEAGWLVEAETDLSVSQFPPRISRMPTFEFRECVREKGAKNQNWFPDSIRELRRVA